MDPADYLGLVGAAISVNEKAAIRCSLALLKTQHDGATFSLWGRVQGYQKDYLIAQKAGDSLLDPRVSYFSIDGGTTWTKLEPVEELQRNFCEQIRGPFVGDPKYEYKIQKDLPPEEPAAVDQAAIAAKEAVENEKAPDEEEKAADDDGEGEEEATGEEKAPEPAADEEGEVEEKKPAKKRPKFQIIAIQEAVRLSHFIEDHDKACIIVPRGAYRLTSDNSVVHNRTFRGLDIESSTQLKNYFKLKQQLNPKVNEELFGPTYTSSWDFLVSIINDIPEGVWTAKYDATMSVAVLQNLDYLGSCFFLKTNSSDFCQFYVGNGERNLDLCFMLP